MAIVHRARRTDHESVEVPGSYTEAQVAVTVVDDWQRPGVVGDGMALQTAAPPSDLPNLRGLHDDLIAGRGEDDFLLIQLDRMIDAVDTMAFLLVEQRDELMRS